MRIAVIGASGRSGRLVAAELRRRGHVVVGVVRSAARAAGLDLDEVAEAQGTDAVALATAVTGVDAVVSTVGPVKGESPTVMRDSTTALLAAMTEQRVRRLVVITASGWVVDGDDPLSRYLAKPILDRVLRDANADLGATEALVHASDRDWTIVRPPRLLDGDARGQYRQRWDGNVRWGYSIRRADLALAVADLLEAPLAIGRTVSVSA